MSIETVPMYGPSISDPSRIVNRDVPKNDIQAYKAAGYQMGSVKELVYTLEDAIAQNDGVDVTAVVEKPTTRKRGSK